jgi:hypothetical protein
MATTAKSKPAVAALTLDGIGSVPLTWDKGAMYRAEVSGLYEIKGLGLARAVLYVWCMAPAAVRQAYASPEDLAAIVPSVVEMRSAIDAAIAASGEEMKPKNVFGSTSGPSPSSS